MCLLVRWDFGLIVSKGIELGLLGKKSIALTSEPQLPFLL